MRRLDPSAATAGQGRGIESPSCVPKEQVKAIVNCCPMRRARHFGKDCNCQCGRKRSWLSSGLIRRISRSNPTA